MSVEMEPLLLFDVHVVTGTDGQPFVKFPTAGYIKVIDMHNWDNDCGPCGMAIFCTPHGYRGRSDQYIHLISNIYLETNRTCGVIGHIPVGNQWSAQATMENSTAGDRCELRILFQPNPYELSKL